MPGMRTYRIIEFLENGVRVEDDDGKIQVFINIRLPKYAVVGDIIRWCEHKFYDVIDEDGNVVYR